jgi:octaprenyl-diphosphate synthase
MTLPLIFTLNKVDKDEKKFIINTIKNDSKNSKKVEKIIELVKENKGLEFAESKMNYYFNESIKLLDNFENNDAKKSLTQLVEYVVKRKK